MAGVVNIEIVGTDEVITKLQNFANIVKLVPAVDKALGRVESAAKSLAPVDTGALRNSIHISPAHTEGRKIVGWVYTAKEYAAYVEFGTGVRGDGSYDRASKFHPSYKQDWAGQQAQPFLYPALADNADYARKVIQSAVRQIAKGTI